MTWLLWKDYRLNRLIVIVGLMLFVVPHAVALAAAWRLYVVQGISRFSANLLFSSAYSAILSQLTVALLGGHAIACERVDRSAEFLAYLPVSRARILASKLIFALPIVAVVWVPNLLIYKLAAAELPTWRGTEAMWSGLGYAAITGATFFGVGWLLSSMLESPTFAVCGGLIAPLVVVIGLQFLGYALDYPLEEFIKLWYPRVCLTLAAACFVAGTWHYLRRVEP
jgi:ABC-type transport system involved in multi-copper enzyme maturation permease subunit